MKKYKPTAQDRANAVHSQLAFFERLGFSKDEAAAWIAAKFNFPPCAADWRNAGFGPEEAALWCDIGERDNPVTPREAKSAKAQGETPKSYRRNRNRTYPSPMRTR